MEGFTAAMNPSLGLLGCCHSRVGRSYESFGGMHRGNRDELDEGQPEISASGNTPPCGVGIELLQDNAGAFYVSGLIPEGA